MRKAACGLPLALAIILALIILGSPARLLAATTGQIQGMVRQADGTPAQSARVMLFGVSGSMPLVTKTDKSGAYLFTGIQPGTYNLHVELVTYKSEDSQVTVVQDITSTVDFTLQKSTESTGSSHLIAPSVRSTDPSQLYTITARQEQQTKGQPNDLYQFTGLLFGEPGITYDSQDFAHVRGTDVNQVGYEIDGIPVTEPLDNNYATDTVTVGMKSVNLYTDGADASFGGSTGGYLNEITENGRDMKGGSTELTYGPGHGWNYLGTNTQYGNVTPDNKFDYYVGTIDFRSGLPGNTGYQEIASSSDNVAKLNYYADPHDTFTFMHNQGFELYDFYQPYNAADTFKYNPTLGTEVDTGTYQQDHEDQGYTLDYFSLNHKFDPSSFLTARVYRLYGFGIFNAVNVHGAYLSENETDLGGQLDYTKDFSKRDELKAGLWYMPSTTYYHSISNITAPIATAANPNGASFYFDTLSDSAPQQYVGYVSNQLKAVHDKLVLTTGLRYSYTTFLNQQAPDVVDKYLDPRAGLTYSPTRDFVLRTHYDVQSQNPDSNVMDILFPENGVAPITASDPELQLQTESEFFNQFNRLRPEHGQDYGVGAEKAFTFLGGPWDTTLDVFKHRQTDLLQIVDPTVYPIAYGNGGHSTSSGLEFQLSKKARTGHESDWTGFVSYTNQVAKATSTLTDTGYYPYFYTYFSGAANVTPAMLAQQDDAEYPTSYDQRHTVALVATKRFCRLLESSFVLDAGSGFPFFNSAPLSDDAQHAEHQIGTADLVDVPVTLPNQQTLQPFNAVPGQTGWHYKLSINTNIHVSERVTCFFNVDNIFDSKTVLNYGTETATGLAYYDPPTAQYPQGKIYYGPVTLITPIFTSIGVKYSF